MARKHFRPDDCDIDDLVPLWKCLLDDLEMCIVNLHDKTKQMHTCNSESWK